MDSVVSASTGAFRARRISRAFRARHLGSIRHYHLPTFAPARDAIAFILVTAMLDIVAMGIVIPVHCRR